MKKIFCAILHDWSQWSGTKEERAFVRQVGNQFIRTTVIQGRSCFRCGKIQERVVRVIGLQRCERHADGITK